MSEKRDNIILQEKAGSLFHNFSLIIFLILLVFSAFLLIKTLQTFDMDIAKQFLISYFFLTLSAFFLIFSSSKEVDVEYNLNNYRLSGLQNTKEIEKIKKNLEKSGAKYNYADRMRKLIAKLPAPQSKGAVKVNKNNPNPKMAVEAKPTETKIQTTKVNPNEIKVKTENGIKKPVSQVSVSPALASSVSAPAVKTAPVEQTQEKKTEIKNSSSVKTEIKENKSQINKTENIKSEEYGNTIKIRREEFKPNIPEPEIKKKETGFTVKIEKIKSDISAKFNEFKKDLEKISFKKIGSRLKEFASDFVLTFKKLLKIEKSQSEVKKKENEGKFGGNSQSDEKIEKIAENKLENQKIVLEQKVPTNTESEKSESKLIINENSILNPKGNNSVSQNVSLSKKPVSPDEIPANRRTKEVLIKEWRKKNPKGTKTQCAKELGVSPNTVRKWWQ